NLYKQFHIVAKQHLYTQAGQPENGAELVANEDYSDSETTTKLAISGRWRSNWWNVGDSNAKKTMPWLDSLGDAVRTTVRWWKDFCRVTDQDACPTEQTPMPQAPDLPAARFRLMRSYATYYKLEIAVAG